MKRLSCVLLLAALAYSVSAEESLLVTSDGDGIWGTGITQAGAVVKYISKDTGAEKTLSADKLHGIVPSVVRGKKYTDDEIQKNIDLITNLKRRHKSLYRQLQTLQQGWQALQRPTSDLEGSINKFKQEFESSDKSTKSYKDAVLGLGMVQFKDMGGKYTDKIKGYIEDIKTDYIETNKQRLEEQAASADTMSFNEFVDFAQLTENVAKELDNAGRSNLKASLETTRQKVIDGQCKAAYTAFVATRSIDGYLDAASIMLGTKDHVAETGAQQGAIDKRMESLITMTKTSNPGYNIDPKGYPLSPETRKMVAEAGNYCSFGSSGNGELHEEIFIIPARRPSGLVFGRPFSFPVRLIAQRAQPVNRKFAFAVIYPGVGMFMHDITAVSFKAGEANVIFSENFKNVDGVQLQPTEDGRLYFYFYVACKDSQTDWMPLSRTCFWDISQ